MIALSGCGHAEEAETDFRPGAAERLDDGAIRVREDSLPFLTVSTVGEEQVATLVRAPGRVAFREGAVSEVGAPASGRVTEVQIRVGQHVDAGAPLFSITSPSAAAVRGELARARVMAQAAQAELTRQEAMMSSGIGVEIDHVRARADVAQSRAMLLALAAGAGSIGRGAAATVQVRAPIAGTVLARRASVGMAVEAGGDPLVVLGEPGAVWIVAEVFERELPLIRIGAAAQVAIASLSDPVPARVDSLGGSVDASTRRGQVYLTVDGQAAIALRAGMYARAEIEVGEAGLGIPASAVLVKDAGRTVVFLQRAERTFEPREIRIGAPVAGRAPVLAGLAPTDKVVTRGALLLDGQAEILR